MPTYSVSQLIGKTFYAKQKIGLYKTTASASPYAYVNAGGYIGKLDSWIEKGDQLWFLFKYGNNEQFVIKYIPYSIDQSVIKSEGAKTVEQEAKEKELAALQAGGLGDHIEYYLRKYGLWILGAFVAGKAINKFIK